MFVKYKYEKCRYFKPFCRGENSLDCRVCLFEGQCKMGTCAWCKNYDNKLTKCKVQNKVNEEIKNGWRR